MWNDNKKDTVSLVIYMIVHPVRCIRYTFNVSKVISGLSWNLWVDILGIKTNDYWSLNLNLWGLPPRKCQLPSVSPSSVINGLIAIKLSRWPCSLTHQPDLNMLIYLQLETVHICMLYASSEKSIIFFRRGWCKCPSVKYGVYSDKGLHPFGPKSNIYGTSTTASFIVTQLRISLLYCHMKKNPHGWGIKWLFIEKNGSVNMPVIPRNCMGTHIVKMSVKRSWYPHRY